MFNRSAKPEMKFHPDFWVELDRKAKVLARDEVANGNVGLDGEFLSEQSAYEHLRRCWPIGQGFERNRTMGLQKRYDAMLGIFEELKREVKEKLPYEYVRWKAYGFQMDRTFVSQAPNLADLVEMIDGAEDGNEEDEDAMYS